MKIALVTYSIEIGGVETVLQLLARYFTDKGHHVDFIETLKRGCWTDYFQSKGFSVISIIQNPILNRRRHIRRIAEVLKNYDVVFLNDAPLAQSVIGFLPNHAVVIPILHMGVPSMIENAFSNHENWDILVTVSPAALENGLPPGIPQERVRCVPNGVAVQSEYPKSTEYLKEGKLRLLYVGAIRHEQKGVFHLPEIFRSLNERGLNAELRIIGEGRDLPMLLEEAKTFPDVHVEGGGSQEEVRLAMTWADIILMPSYYEGLPMVLLEAMAQGVVPVVSHLPKSTDFVIDDGIDGFLCPPGDINAFSVAIELLAHDPDRLRNMSLKAWQKVHERFSAQAMGKAYLDLTEECSVKRQNRPPRFGKIDYSRLGDFPALPIFALRPVRKALRILGLYNRY